MNRFLNITAAAVVALGLAGSATAGSTLQPGFIVRAEDRFDPVIQRLIAEHSLRALPLEHGRLYYYFYPVGTELRFEGAQIRYLEMLLDKAAEKKAEQEATEEDGP